MKHVVYTDPEQCRQIWKKKWPVKELSDLWDVRFCFHESYQNPMQFHTIEQNGRIRGFLPLSWNKESDQFVFFPGEIWKGKTWLEQNRMIADTPEILGILLDAVQESAHLRYLSWHPVFEGMDGVSEDETGYLFYPGMYDFSFENYWLGFSGKSRKKIRNEMKKLEAQELTFRFNTLKDIDRMFALNRAAFADHSYFKDPRFYEAFERLADFLSESGMLRIVTVLVKGKVAAVDLGGIFNHTYTLFAGGTHPDFPGIAKLINLHHMEWACQKRFTSVDFLCGDFNWKKRFHLSPRPLYEMTINMTAAEEMPVSDFSWGHLRNEALYA